MPGRTHAYELVAVDVAGERSAPVGVDPDGLDVGDGTGSADTRSIRQDTWRPLLAEVARLVNRTPFDARRDAQVALGNRRVDTPGFTVLERTDEYTRYGCDAGGDLAAFDAYRNSNPTFRLFYRDCTLGSGTTDGYFDVVTQPRGSGAGARFVAFTERSPDGALLRLDGAYVRGDDRVSVADSHAWSDLTWYDERPEGTTLVEDYTVSMGMRRASAIARTRYPVPQSDGSTVDAVRMTDRAEVEGGFTVTAPLTGGAALDVSVALAYRHDWVLGGGRARGHGPAGGSGCRRPRAGLRCARRPGPRHHPHRAGRRDPFRHVSGGDRTAIDRTT